MKKIIKVLITGAGAPGIAGTIYALRQNQDNRQFRIITTDISRATVGEYLADAFYLVPAPENKSYIPKIKKIIKDQKINVIIPQTTREIITLSKYKEELERLGLTVLVSNYEAILRANDKYHIILECQKTHVPYPDYFLCNCKADFARAVDKLGYPDQKVVVKPRISNGMRGLRILTEDDLTPEQFLNEKPNGMEIKYQDFLSIFQGKASFEFLVTEFLPGLEYTIDVFRNKQNCIVIPRIRLLIRSGISFYTKTHLREDLISYSKRLAESLDLQYSFGFQFKLDQLGKPKILEANPRIQGTMVSSCFAGFNMIYASVLEAIGEPVDLTDVSIKDNVEFLRYWGGFGIDGNDILGKI